MEIFLVIMFIYFILGSISLIFLSFEDFNRDISFRSGDK